MNDNWLKNAADLETKLEKSEYRGYCNAYKHYLQMFDTLGFTSMSAGRVVRLADFRPVLENLILYYEQEINK